MRARLRSIDEFECLMSVLFANQMQLLRATLSQRFSSHTPVILCICITIFFIILYFIFFMLILTTRDDNRKFIFGKALGRRAEYPAQNI